MRENALMHGPQMERSASDPVGERRAIEANSLALVDVGLAVERQVIGIFGDEHVRDRCFRRQAAFDQPRRGRRLDDDVLGVAAGVFGSAHDQHPELRRHDIELLADVLANLVKLAPTARTGLVLDVDNRLDARQMRKRCFEPTFSGAVADGDIRSVGGLRHMSISEHKHVSEGEAVPARRIEIFTGAGRRRSWTEQEKAAIVAESFEDGVRTCHVARRHGLTPQQLFTWRREARRKVGDESDAPPFVSAIVEAPTRPPRRLRSRPRAKRAGDAPDHRAGHRRVERLDLARRGYDDGDGDHRRVEGGQVIGPTGAVRVMVATKPVDFRKGAEGLAALVREQMQADPFSGAVYVFRAKRADRVKLIFWDGTGVCLFAKRLEDGKFRWPSDARMA